MMNGYSDHLAFSFLIIAIMAIPIPCCPSTSFLFNGFQQNISEIRLSGVAVLDPSGMLRLTNFSSRVFGHALYCSPVLFKKKGGNNNTNLVASFATTFVFSITPLTPTIGGHGLAFFVAPLLEDSNYTAIQYMGLLNASNDGGLSNHLFAVEFDIYQNEDLDDIDNNHVGINLNSMKSVEAVPAAYRRTSNQFQPLNLKGGQNIQAWIYYDGLTQLLNVSIANAGQQEPPFPLLSTQLTNLSSVLQDTAYVGFSAGTGSLFAVQSILAWSFNNNGSASPLDLSQLPRLRGTAPARSLSRGAIAGFTLFAVTLFCVVAYTLLRVYKRRQTLIKEELLEDWGLELNGPHRFSYKELSEATNGFAEEQLVGEGGFGVVFRGILPSTGVEVAVKRLSNQSQKGVREFMAELSSMSRLRHRNLVQLQGWSRRRGSGELLLVIDYMSNGSLDQMLYHSSSLPLSWARRYNILKDVAAALVYLHEEWEQQVLHRDVKSNNILLDANLNAKLGDFGLARLHEHGKNSHTTRVVGTLGYLAPEYIQSGKATASCDVFSFGAVMLEVACGRRPLDVQRPDEEERVLVNWVLGLLLQGSLQEATDPKLCSEYVKEEMECVLQLGLICSNPNPIARPTMRQVLQILTGSAPLPLLPPFKSLQTTASSSSSANALDTSLASYTTIISQATGR